MKYSINKINNRKRCTGSIILVIDFGSQYTQLLLRIIRKLGVYSKFYAFSNITQAEIYALNPDGIILSGGPGSVLESDMLSEYFSNFIFQLQVPILGICYGMQIMTMQFGGNVQCTGMKREFGNTQITIFSESMLTKNIYDRVDNKGNFVLDVWMSHSDVVTDTPEGFVVVGMTNNNQIAIIANEDSRLYGIQFHPEVTHTKQGQNLLERFVMQICSCKPYWNKINIIENIITKIRSTVKEDRVILAFSGGTDSFVTALLLKRAIGNKFICIFIDNGLLCNYECIPYKDLLQKDYNLNFMYIKADRLFFDALQGVIDPEEKRKTIGKMFIQVFEDQIKNFPGVKWLAQGTIYSDIIESGTKYCLYKNIIKSHHNVGGLPKKMSIKLLEPIKFLFKDEVRSIGLDLGLSSDIVYRYPFPGPGLAIRILGEVKKEYCDILRKVDIIFIEELKKKDLYTKISQAFAVFLPINSVGVQGDRRQYKWVIALRAVETIDFMTAHWVKLPYDVLESISNRIVNEVEEISRVVYDISCKPPSTIEWE